MKKLLCLLFVATACGGGGNNDGMDGNPGGEAVPMMVTISGTASTRGLGGASPAQGVTIAAYATSDEATPLAMATTDAAGAFTLTITTTGSAINGYLEAKKSGLITSYLYPPTPITGNLAMVPMNMVQANLWDTLSTFAMGNQMPQNGLVAMIVVGGTEVTSPPVAGATITTSPASNPYRYNAANGLPDEVPTSTAADGIGYAFNAPVGNMTVTASKSGSTFKTTPIKVRAMTLTQTLVIQ
ncbi:MAG: hypothetical protein M4D80_02410 [Myxococcota bacterium]|nr:hypothetical protein [Deltaproteobacteria bacterium]MDQ3333986.1 hypothetical protein [Myxococcota bacterium]